MNDHELILNFLKAHRLLSLATVGSSGPWIANVFYAIDDDLNIYFLSYNKSRHAMEIAENGLVAIAIANSEQKLLGKKVGVQIQGMVEEVKQGDDHSEAIELWLKAQEGYEGEKILDSVKAKFMSGTIYKVRPQLIRYLNEELFGETGVKDIEL